MGNRSVRQTLRKKLEQSSQAMRQTPEIGEVKNIQPMSRKERLSHQHREDLEKMRLRQRRENFCHYEENSMTQPPGSLGFISEAERFVTDVAAVEKGIRDAEIAKKDTITHAKRYIPHMTNCHAPIVFVLSRESSIFTADTH